MTFDSSPTHHADPSPRLCKTRYGVVAAARGNGLIARSLHSYGEWMEQELDLLSGLLQEANSVLEFGGELGAHALWLARTVGATGQVHVAEPRRLDLQQLCANVALNELSNVHTHALWLGRESRTAELGTLMAVDGAMARERVRCSTVDDLALDALHLVKVNLPGTLVPLLQGATETLRRHRPLFYIRLGSGEEAVAEVQALKDAGYRCWSHLPYLFSKDNFNGDEKNQFPGRVNQNLIAAPIESRLELDRLREI